LVEYTKEIVENRGHVSESTLNEFLAAGYTAPQAIEVLLGVALKTVSNYLDHFNPVRSTPLSRPRPATKQLNLGEA
jgi:hypothetical protein